MKFARFIYENEDQTREGMVIENTIKEIKGDMFEEWSYTGAEFELDHVTFKSPIHLGKVIGIGKNYLEKEEDRPLRIPDILVFFFKPLSSIIGPDDPIVLPANVNEVKFEAELAIVIGKKAKNISASQARNHIYGYTIANDVTAPEFFHENGHWTLGKACDTFLPLGPIIETDLNLAEVKIQSFLNGEKCQDSSLNLLIVDVFQMIAYLSEKMTLEAGDVILTGTPVGATYMKEHDKIECVISGIGSLSNSVIKLSRPV